MHVFRNFTPFSQFSQNIAKNVQKCNLILKCFFHENLIDLVIFGENWSTLVSNAREQVKKTHSVQQKRTSFQQLNQIIIMEERVTAPIYSRELTIQFNYVFCKALPCNCVSQRTGVVNAVWIFSYVRIYEAIWFPWSRRHGTICSSLGWNHGAIYFPWSRSHGTIWLP